MGAQLEIGSEFWEIPTGERENGIFHKNTKWFLSGRSALQAIIKENSFKSASLPNWCCDSMILPFLRAGISVSFYDAFNPPQTVDSDVILVMDYFGFSSGFSYENYTCTVIRDLTHSLFSRQYGDADYCFGSLRKWAGFYTGGFAWGFKKNVQYENVKSQYTEYRRSAMKLKAQYITGRMKTKDYLAVFSAAEDLLDNIGIEMADMRDIEKAWYLDADLIKSTRRNNAQILLDAFSDIAIFNKIKSDDCPMFVPIRLENRNNIRQRLIENEIYCPVHWPVSPFHRLDGSVRALYENELSLVCDQRYGENEMYRMIDTIKKYLG